MNMFILTDGKNYVMENPMKVGIYLSTTSPCHAKEFTYKQARNLLHNKKKSLSWIREYHMINMETGKVETDVPEYSNNEIFCDDKEIVFDDSIIQEIQEEVNGVLKLKTMDTMQLNTYVAQLEQGLQFYDSAISDIYHARMDKRPPAHIRTKVDGILNELSEKRRDIKQTMNYLKVFSDSVKERWTLGKVKEELRKVKYVPYKGRTKYYEMVSDLLKNY